jgi:hypothetical protein
MALRDLTPEQLGKLQATEEQSSLVLPANECIEHFERSVGRPICLYWGFAIYFLSRAMQTVESELLMRCRCT